MPSKYWIKLYQEILEDPKMGRLPDNLWRRSIELFLLAGELGSDLKEEDRGHLPATGEIAWRLRQPEEELEAELHQLAEIGILTQTDTGWLVTNFVKRQEYVKPAERMKQYRERKRDKELNTILDQDDKVMNTRSVTHRNAEIESDIEIESSPKGEGDKSPSAKPKRAKKESVAIPEAVRVYQEIARRLPDRAIWLDIETKVGATPESLERWGMTITAYIGCGWNKLNLSGMLKFFEENRTPSTQPQKPQNGILPANKSSPLNPDKQATYDELLAAGRQKE